MYLWAVGCAMLLSAPSIPPAGAAYIQAPAGYGALPASLARACRRAPLLDVSRTGTALGLQCRGYDLDRRKLIVSGGLGLLSSGLALPVRTNAVPEVQRAPLVPEIPLNELDDATASAIEGELRALAEKGLQDDTVFAFRGGVLSKTSSDGALQYLARRNAVFFGEKHDSADDKELATRIIRELDRRRGGVVVGLEMVQQPFQRVLDWYVFAATPSKGSDKILFERTQWAKRWGWDYEAYLPVLHYCQVRKIRLLALNVEAEVTARVREGGLETLNAEERGRLIIDGEGFMTDALAPSFAEYANSVLRPSFEAHVSMGMFADDPGAFRKFVQNRILWDETMATTAARYLFRNPDKMLVGLVGGDHVKTGHGIPARIERILLNSGFANPRTASVALNPSWKLLSAAKPLVDLDRSECAANQALYGQRSLCSTAEVPAREEGWTAPPPPVHHPLSDIVWFS